MLRHMPKPSSATTWRLSFKLRDFQAEIAKDEHGGNDSVTPQAFGASMKEPRHSSFRQPELERLASVSAAA
jgi:hypothetical protein